MAWYEDRFTNFFSRWKRGYLYTKDKKSFYGEVKQFNVAKQFDESTIAFNNLGDSVKGTKEITFVLKDVIYFRASDGPIFNVSKYLSIINLQRTAEADEVPKDKKEKDLVCIAFGLEFYASADVAKVLKSDVRDILMTRFKDYPLIFVEEQKAVKMTPSVSSFFGKIKSFFKRKK